MIRVLHGYDVFFIPTVFITGCDFLYMFGQSPGIVCEVPVYLGAAFVW